MNICQALHLEMSSKCFYMALFYVSDQTDCTLVVFNSEWVIAALHSVFWLSPKWLKHCLVVTWLVPRETAAVSAHVLCTTAQIHFIRSHIRRVHVCLAVSCHLPFWQNGRDLLRFIAVTRGRNGYEIRVSTKKGGERKKERQTERKKTTTTRTYCPFGPRMSGGRVSSLSGHSVASPSRVERVLRMRGVLIFNRFCCVHLPQFQC